MAPLQVHRRLERLGEKAAQIRDAYASENGWGGVLKIFGNFVSGS